MTMSDDKKYKYTRQLLKIAKQESGYTNKAIEKKAGLSGSSSSLASRWLNGHALATERQMRYFINNYGHLLKRKMEHLYYQIQPQGNSIVTNYMKFSGDIIFKHQIKLDFSRVGGGYSSKRKNVSAIRIIVIEDAKCFKLLFQYRAGLVTWKSDNQSEKPSFSPRLDDLDGVLSSDIEDSNWFLWETVDCSDVDSLIDTFSNVINLILGSSNIVDIAAYNTGRFPEDRKSSLFFTFKEVGPMEFAFYQKLMKLGLQSKLLPF